MFFVTALARRGNYVASANGFDENVTASASAASTATTPRACLAAARLSGSVIWNFDSLLLVWLSVCCLEVVPVYLP